MERAEEWTGTNCKEHLFNITCMFAIHFVKPSANITPSNPHTNLYSSSYDDPISTYKENEVPKHCLTMQGPSWLG